MVLLAVLMYTFLFLLPINGLILLAIRRERQAIKKLHLAIWRSGGYR